MIELINITKFFGTNCAVNNVDLRIEDGDFFALLGPNGAGKSTILGMISGLITPSKGYIKINGTKLDLHRKKSSFSIGVLFENPSFYEYLSGRDNITMLAKLKDCNNKKEIEQLIDTISLSEYADILVNKYSLGMKQRLALACALLNNPDILILDEPTNGLDPEGIHAILNLLTHYIKKGNKTIIISSHQVHDMEAICNKIAIINNGNILIDGMLSDLLNDHSSSYLLTTNNPKECEMFLKNQSWMKNFQFINHKRGLKDFYIESIKKGKQ